MSFNFHEKGFQNFNNYFIRDRVRVFTSKTGQKCRNSTQIWTRLYGRHSGLLLLQKITGRKNENLLTFCFKFLKKCLSAYTYILLNDLASKVLGISSSDHGDREAKSCPEFFFRSRSKKRKFTNFPFKFIKKFLLAYPYILLKYLASKIIGISSPIIAIKDPKKVNIKRSIIVWEFCKVSKSYSAEFFVRGILVKF